MKRRLIGAIVLISLAVIFVPMIFDVRDTSQPRLESEGIPAKPPGFKVEVLPLNLPDAQSTKTEVAAGTAGEADKAGSPQAAPRSDAAQSSGANDAEPSPTTRPHGAQSPGTAQPTTRAAAESGSGEQAWVVQVGSFSSMSNAASLRDRLQGSGFKTFIERSRIAGDTTVRVRVGPESTRSAAERLRAGIKKKFGLEGIVVEYSTQ